MWVRTRGSLGRVLKEGTLRSAVEVCGEAKVRRERRRTAWWSKEVQEAVRAKKHESEESKE